MPDPHYGELAPELDLEADRLRALMRANVFKKKHQPVTIGRFEIVRLLGSGAMGIVYEAVDPRDGEAVAIKVLRSDNPRALTMFKKEFRALSLLSHPNLVALYELGRADQQFFFTMELVRGIPLQRYLWGLDLPDPTGRDDDPASSTSRASALSVSPVTDFERLRDVFGQLAAGVSALHQAGKLHRDIKPTNALVTDRGRVVLMDFGFVSEQGLGPLDSTQGNMVVGTPAFMAPEQARAERATAANDWYSVGATLYMTLTGQAPFGTLSLLEMMQAKQERAPVAPRTLVRGIPEDLGELCLRLLDPDPSRRPDEATIFSVFRRDSEAPRAAAVRSRPLLGPSARPEVDVALYGRDDVLASLVALHEEAIARGPVVAFLRGRAGVGKSAVAREFTRARTRGDAVVLKARCYERDATLFKTVDGVVDALARHLKDLDDAAVRAVLPARVEQLARLFPALLQVQAIARRSERADAPSEPADRSSRRTLEFAALKELLTKLSDQAPLVLWIDDLHWTDIDSARVLAELLRPPGASRLLLLATFRSEDADRSPGLAPLLELEQARAVITRTLDLGPLAVGDCEAIARALLQRKIPDATASDATTIAREAQGNPLYVHELVRFLARERLVGGAPRQLSLEALLHVRIAQLPAPTLRLLEIVAVAGRPIVSELALAAAGIEREGRAVIQHLINEDLLHGVTIATRPCLEASNDRTRRAAIARVDGVTLRAHHERLAGVLERDGHSDHEVLAEHYRAAGQLARAQDHVVAAADAATALGEHARAATCLRVALELSADDPIATGRLRRALADALARAGRGLEAARAYLESDGAAPGEALELQAQAVYQLLALGHLDRGRRVLADALAAVGMRMPGPGRPGRVVRWLRRSSRQLRRLSTPARDAPLAAIDRARIDLCEAASTGLFAHDLTASSAFQARMLRLALEARDPDRIARAVALEALHHALGGATTAALTAQTLARARSLAARGEEPATARLIDYVHAASHLLRGAFDAAARACEALRPEYDHRARERAWERTNLRAHALTCAVIRGAYTEVASELSAWIADARGRGDTYAEALATRLATWIALARGDAGALPQIQEARALYRDAPRGQLSTQLALTEAAARVATGDRAAAGDILDQLWAPMTRAAVWELQALRVEAHFIRGLARLGRGDAGDDIAALERERFTGAAELAAVLRAGQLRSEGPELAQRRLDEATTDLARAGLQLHASLARRLASPRA